MLHNPAKVASQNAPQTVTTVQLPPVDQGSTESHPPDPGAGPQSWEGETPSNPDLAPSGDVCNLGNSPAKEGYSCAESE